MSSAPPLERTRGGFSSIELLIALTIFLIVSAGVSVSFTASRSLTRASSELDVAVTALQLVAEEMLSAPMVQIPTLYPEGQSIALADYGLKDLGIVPTYPNFTPGGVVPDGLEIQLTATWTSFRESERSQDYWTAKGP